MASCIRKTKAEVPEESAYINCINHQYRQHGFQRLLCGSAIGRESKEMLPDSEAAERLAILDK